MQASDIVWASRWDTYLAMSDVQIHWFAIVNSVVIVLFLSGKFMLVGIYFESFIHIQDYPKSPHLH